MRKISRRLAVPTRYGVRSGSAQSGFSKSPWPRFPKRSGIFPTLSGKECNSFVKGQSSLTSGGILDPKAARTEGKRTLRPAAHALSRTTRKSCFASRICASVLWPGMTTAMASPRETMNTARSAGGADRRDTAERGGERTQRRSGGPLGACLGAVNCVSLCEHTLQIRHTENWSSAAVRGRTGRRLAGPSATDFRRGCILRRLAPVRSGGTGSDFGFGKYPHGRKSTP